MLLNAALRLQGKVCYRQLADLARMISPSPHPMMLDACTGGCYNANCPNASLQTSVQLPGGKCLPSHTACTEATVSHNLQ